ncbi:Zinc uptake regulation protein [Methylobacterium cerastii]|uniref:Zinc uptake regulation protein n=1 Tax=Methylobacterium cerastii TaxID=932741 RepID=A0ABQ4QC51_9HYPH|nr:MULTISPECIES: Fur family transcriptional regulator [Methylobacterium]TXN07053.1 transcriptional repressor [Methylobacterium sp. WL122]TXM65298.1 transcriptional repressor [Methylobacterium sp. WL120]TXM76752.1 transcriptional repressor [Methylobacterium sp. WL12]TXN02640.1 transcriptional repressor [Methylobacterium sp. WL103]TXN85014.1 transcriptional repressor [Methylobacterium sp. WL8]
MHDHAGHEGGACGADHAAATMARAEKLCRDRSLHFTKLRHDVLQAVAETGKPMGAYDIAERLSGPERRVAAVSVYRALDFLTENGLVHRIASRNAFVSCAHEHGAGEGLVFLICRSCGGIDETTSPEIEAGLGRTLERAGFRPASRILEVEGECGACHGRQGDDAH